jgi:branched-chain amino acid transport system substrate-binding protein
MKHLKTLLIALVAVIGSGVWLPAAAQLAGTQFIGITGYRVGPYGANGAAFFTGFIDYLNLVNERDGGINGVKLSWEECETEYNNAKGLECYERLKTRPPPARRRSTRCRPASPTALLDKAPTTRFR